MEAKNSDEKVESLCSGDEDEHVHGAPLDVNTCHTIVNGGDSGVTKTALEIDEDNDDGPFSQDNSGLGAPFEGSSLSIKESQMAPIDDDCNAEDVILDLYMGHKEQG